MAAYFALEEQPPPEEMSPGLLEYIIRRTFRMTHEEFLNEEWLSIKEMYNVHAALRERRKELFREATKPQPGKGDNPTAWYGAVLVLIETYLSSEML